jgi:hypothetical protein
MSIELEIRVARLLGRMVAEPLPVTLAETLPGITTLTHKDQEVNQDEQKTEERRKQNHVCSPIAY